ncbi:hypothetical protein [Streptomyces sp. NBC_01565]|uniref:hypothetical protein n=1 Tax=Streptomyces sp. NBC_01565 TaxID=2975881 RepID=UPI0022560026|nr:hypothetical protein [Streptomyces sp. NBC_01565]MCX4541288.1 hypothetical protein [Streptomyces sp. NBC_01565]
MRLDIDFPSDRVQQLQKVLSPEIDADRIARMIAEIGAVEALDQAIGKDEPRTLLEQRHHRVKALLLKGVGMEDAEVVVSALFKIPPSSARRLIETTAARFDVELRGGMMKAAREAFEGAHFNAKKISWEVRIPSSLIRKWIQEEVLRGGEIAPKKSGRGSVWLFSQGARDYMCAVLEIDAGGSK